MGYTGTPPSSHVVYAASVSPIAFWIQGVTFPNSQPDDGGLILRTTQPVVWPSKHAKCTPATEFCVFCYVSRQPEMAPQRRTFVNLSLPCSKNKAHKRRSCNSQNTNTHTTQTRKGFCGLLGRSFAISSRAAMNKNHLHVAGSFLDAHKVCNFAISHLRNTAQMHIKRRRQTCKQHRARKPRYGIAEECCKQVPFERSRFCCILFSFFSLFV